MSLPFDILSAEGKPVGNVLIQRPSWPSRGAGDGAQGPQEHKTRVSATEAWDLLNLLM